MNVTMHNVEHITVCLLIPFWKVLKREKNIKECSCPIVLQSSANSNSATPVPLWDGNEPTRLQSLHQNNQKRALFKRT
jgi:hypothetical protein